MKIIVLMEVLVLKLYSLIHTLLTKKLLKIIFDYQLKWRNKMMEKL